GRYGAGLPRPGHLLRPGPRQPRDVLPPGGRGDGGLPAQRRNGAGQRLGGNRTDASRRNPRHLRRAGRVPEPERPGGRRRVLGRGPGEVAHLIADTIARARPSLPLTIIPDEAEAVDQALEMARDGDLIVIFVDRVDETIEQVKAASRAAAMEESGSFWVPMPD